MPLPAAVLRHESGFARVVAAGIALGGLLLFASAERGLSQSGDERPCGKTHVDVTTRGKNQTIHASNVRGFSLSCKRAKIIIEGWAEKCQPLRSSECSLRGGRVRKTARGFDCSIRFEPEGATTPDSVKCGEPGEGESPGSSACWGVRRGELKFAQGFEKIPTDRC